MALRRIVYDSDDEEENSDVEVVEHVLLPDGDERNGNENDHQLAINESKARDVAPIKNPDDIVGQPEQAQFPQAVEAPQPDATPNWQSVGPTMSTSPLDPPPPPLQQAPAEPAEAIAATPKDVFRSSSSPHKSSLSKKREKNDDDEMEYNPVPPSKRIKRISPSHSRSVSKMEPPITLPIDVFEFVGSDAENHPCPLFHPRATSKTDNIFLVSSKDEGNIRKHKRSPTLVSKIDECDEEKERQRKKDEEEEGDLDAAASPTKRKKRARHEEVGNQQDEDIYVIPLPEDDDEEDVWLPSRRRHNSKSKGEDDEKGQTRRATRGQGNGDLVPPLPRPKRPKRRKREEGGNKAHGDDIGDDVSRVSSKKVVDGKTNLENVREDESAEKDSEKRNHDPERNREKVGDEHEKKGEERRERKRKKKEDRDKKPTKAETMIMIDLTVPDAVLSESQKLEYEPVLVVDSSEIKEEDKSTVAVDGGGDDTAAMAAVSATKEEMGTDIESASVTASISMPMKMKPEEADDEVKADAREDEKLGTSTSPPLPPKIRSKLGVEPKSANPAHQEKKVSRHQHKHVTTTPLKHPHLTTKTKSKTNRATSPISACSTTANLAVISPSAPKLADRTKSEMETESETIILNLESKSKSKSTRSEMKMKEKLKLDPKPQSTPEEETIRADPETKLKVKQKDATEANETSQETQQNESPTTPMTTKKENNKSSTERNKKIGTETMNYRYRYRVGLSKRDKIPSLLSCLPLSSSKK
ncbi:MAG: hypothetical protein M1823_005854 [Watsoniomyces obsoletus]|nr:MAG: hypothetical protein M1823_005854 [Watsoniomyces obsoletus]